jgi:hypothetical protein
LCFIHVLDSNHAINRILGAGHDHFAVLTSRGSLFIRFGSAFLPIVRRSKRPSGVADFALGGISEHTVKIAILDRIGSVFEAEINLNTLNQRGEPIPFNRVKGLSHV